MYGKTSICVCVLCRKEEYREEKKTFPLWLFLTYILYVQTLLCFWQAFDEFQRTWYEYFFVSFVCAFARSTRSGVLCSSHKCMVWRNISYFLMFHCWSSQHCRLLISYFFSLFFFCVFEREKKGRIRKMRTTYRKLLTSLFETDDVSDEDVWLLLFVFEADTIKAQWRVTEIGLTSDAMASALKMSKWQKTTIKMNLVTD